MYQFQAIQQKNLKAFINTATGDKERLIQEWPLEQMERKAGL